MNIRITYKFKHISNTSINTKCSFVNIL